MIFGDPYRFAIWVECIPQWSDSIKNGFFYFFVNGNMYPEDIRTSTLYVDLYELIDNKHAFICQPCNTDIFNASKKEAFDTMFKLAYPESTEDDEYPEQDFSFLASSTIINESGAYFFAVTNESSIRIIGGVITKLVKGDRGNIWENVKNPIIEEVIIAKSEMNELITELKEYSTSLF